MKPLITKSLLELNDLEMTTFINTRIENRKITSGRKAKGKTLNALSKAWNIAPTAILKAFEHIEAIIMLTMMITAIVGCTKVGVYRLETGKVIQCEEFYESYCGASLYSCDDGMAYYCQKNITEIVDHKKAFAWMKNIIPSVPPRPETVLEGRKSL